MAPSDGGAPAEEPAHHPLVIVGGGIGGLVLALALDQAYNHPQIDGASTAAPPLNSEDAIPDAKDDTADKPNSSSKPRLPIHVYESTAAYKSDAGGAIGLYSNGLRVLKHLSRTHPEVPSLLADVRSAGCDYVYRRWMRHDGTEVAVAREDELLPDVDVEMEGADDDSVGSADINATGSPKQQPMGDSISAPDKEGERANRRPRGGSLGNIRNTLTGGRNLAEMMQALAAKGERPSGASTDSPERTPPRTSRTVEKELLSLGIRRWKYQQVLYESCVKAGIQVHFGKRLQKATSVSGSDGGDAKTLLHFKDGSQITASLLIGADGINSKVRNYVTDPTSQSDPSAEYVPAYTGVTCLMGCANVPRVRGICFPSSATTKCHACYYPTRAPREDTGDDPDDCEQVFQIYFQSPVERPDTWRTLTPEEAREECKELAVKLRSDGWDEQFLKPLESPTLTGVLRVGLRSREGLDCWHVGGDDSDVAEESVGRAVLLGDAAHPPVPYIGQGAQMAMEDAGTLSMLLAHYCPITQQSESASPDFSQYSKAMAVYESLRVSRTKTILGSSVQLGKTQQKRAESKLYNAWREMSIKAQVWAYGTLPVMRPGAAFDYRAAVEEALSAEDGRSKEKEEDEK